MAGPLVVPHVLVICGDARRDPVGPTDLLELRRDIAVIQAGIVAAVAADELEDVGVAALRLAVNHAGRLAPQNHCPPMPGLTGGQHACLLGRGRGGGGALKAAAPVLFSPSAPVSSCRFMIF